MSISVWELNNSGTINEAHRHKQLILQSAGVNEETFASSFSTSRSLEHHVLSIQEPPGTTLQRCFSRPSSSGAGRWVHVLSGVSLSGCSAIMWHIFLVQLGQRHLRADGPVRCDDHLSHGHLRTRFCLPLLHHQHAAFHLLPGCRRCFPDWRCNAKKDVSKQLPVQPERRSPHKRPF